MRKPGRTGWAATILWSGLLVAAGASGAPAAQPERTGPPVPAPHAALALSAGDESARFADFLEAVYQQRLAQRPQLATEFGSRAGYDRWDDRSERALAAAAAEVRDQLDAVKSRFDYAKLDGAAQLQYRVFLDEQQLLLDRYRWRDHLYPLNQIVGLHLEVPGTLTGKQPLENEADAEAYVRRIRAVRPAFRDLMAQMREQAVHGVLMPKSVYPLLIEGARNVISGAPHDTGPDSPIFGDFKRRIAVLDIPANRKQALVENVRAALLRDLQPAYRQLIELLRLQSARTQITGGVWQLPDGDAFYAFLIRQFTTTDLTPAQIHERGLAEVARSQADIASLMQRTGFTGTLREFVAKVKSDPANFFANDEAGRQAYLSRARNIVSAMQEKVTQAFAAPAPLPLRVVRTDSYKEASSPPGFYEPGSADGSSPGTVNLNLFNMRLCPLNELEDLLYHEGIPGHHMQISTILVDRSIPRLRKVNEWWQDSAFVEGWGLYAERLAKDLGAYQDPYSELGLLSGELWRASRLVVDSGLHYRRWTRDQAIGYLNDNTAGAQETNERAVDRYLAVPGQATSFMLGMRRFVAERERARQALGPRFDLREYHAAALGSGYIPLWALSQKIDAYILSKSAPKAPQRDSSALHEMLEKYWQDLLELQPALALSHGDERHLDRFDDSLEDGWRARMLAMLDEYLEASAAFQTQSLEPEDRTSLGMLREEITLAKHYYSSALFETQRMLPINQFDGEHTAFAAQAGGAGDYPFKTLEHYRRALARADHFSRWINQAIARMQQGIKVGVVLPRIVVERVLPQLRVHTRLPAEKTEFWRPIVNLPVTFSAQDRQRLERQYRMKIEKVVQPAYARLFTFLKEDYLPHARDSVGLGAMPGGAALYDYDVRFHTTTALTPTEIHGLGRAEVARIEGELARVQTALGFQGTLQAFFARVRDNPKQKFTTREEIIPAFEIARQKIVPRLAQLFDVLPQAQFQIRALPESSRNSQANGYYAAAGIAGSRPGILWINLFAPGVSDKFNVMTLTLHEGLPGHHFQTSVAQENAQLPSFRRFDFTNAYGEGWALYAESLGKEMGLFEEPWDYYGHLNYAILRANRLVIDTGLHAMGWDVEAGIEWMMQHSSMTRDQAAAEVERYVAIPGQALSYKLGELKIRDLRRQAEQQLGTRFDLKGFHDQILLGGSMPLTILQQGIDRWISAARAEATLNN